MACKTNEWSMFVSGPSDTVYEGFPREYVIALWTLCDAEHDHLISLYAEVMRGDGRIHPRHVIGMPGLTVEHAIFAPGSLKIDVIEYATSIENGLPYVFSSKGGIPRRVRLSKSDPTHIDTPLRLGNDNENYDWELAGVKDEGSPPDYDRIVNRIVNILKMSGVSITRDDITNILDKISWSRADYFEP